MSQKEENKEEEESMTYDEISLRRSKRFMDALQELKNLKPQLYNAAEYCEMSYLQNEQKQVVLENLKDYAVKALINAVDHLGTVAYKLNDLLSQQMTEISTAEVKVACLSQRIQMCQEYTDEQGLKQHLLVKQFPRYYKHYLIPYQSSCQTNNLTKKIPRKAYEREHAKPHPVTYGAKANKSLSWHLAAEARTAFNENQSGTFSNEFYSASSFTGSEAFYLSEADHSSSSFPKPQSRSTTILTNSSTAPNSLGNGRRVSSRAFTKTVQFLLDCSDCTSEPSRKPKETTSCFPF
eukprot:TRINITY_DN5329_c0_g1_i2.p1 TRINITY_DN5329_c0_g1~~TRINITY_DN5329_c0_g1_i2.p1  ORF type:complete len:293 (+),score=64.10 TRINITY_DN5329_c0_g1_i2:724-1602(+)